MSKIDFQNGFLVGLALAYKKQAEGGGFGNYIFKNFVENIVLKILSHTDVVTIDTALINKTVTEPILLSTQSHTDTVSLKLS